MGNGLDPRLLVEQNFSKVKKFSLKRSIHQKSHITTMTYCIYCIPITASTDSGRAGGDNGADIQMTQKMHQNRAFSMSIPCTHETYLWHRSLSRLVARRLVWRPGASL